MRPWTRTIAAAGLLGPALVAPLLAADPTPAWRLGPSDLARYESAVVKKKGGDTIVDDGPPAFVHGHDLRDGGLYLPAGLGRDDLTALFAFRTPAAGPFEWRFRLIDTTDVKVAGKAAVTAPSAETLEIKVDATFESAGKAGEFDQFTIKDGEAHATITFDRTAGVVKAARVELWYSRDKSDPKKGDRPASVLETREYKLAAVSALGYGAFPADVNGAIDRGVAHLRTLQKEGGHFEPYSGQDAGTTALCIYTLASCGVPVTDPAIEKALILVCGAPMTRTYEQAVGLMAVERAYTPPEEIANPRPADGRKPVRNVPKERREWCERTAAALESAAGSPGSWGYPDASNALYKFDTSNTQYAVLGMQAAARLGIAVKDQTWLGVLRHFSQVREPDGPKGSVLLLRAGQAVTETVAPLVVPKVAGYRYRPSERRSWGSMTCAGIASLSIARDELRRAKRITPAMEADIDAGIAGAWAWLDQHWGMDRHPEKPGADWYYYWLYALERAAILDGVQRVSGRDWYFEGATELLARQAKDGSWDEPGGNHTAETCFALLFLKRATAPLTPK